MKTTVEINDDLLQEARRLLKTGTIRDTVNASMEFVVRQARLKHFAEALGTIDLDLTPEVLRRHRGRRTNRGAR